MSKAGYTTIIIGFIVLVLIVGGGLLLGFNMVNSNISSFQQKFTEKDSLRNSINDTRGPLLLDFSNVDSLGNVTLTEKDVGKLNGHIKYLTAEIEEEYVKTQELIDADIDRIGIMMTITIGILTLLLGVLPFLSNLITRQDMRQEVSRLTDKVDTAKVTTTEVQQSVTQAEEAANNANTTAQTANTTAQAAESIATQQTELVNEVSQKTERLSKDIADNIPKVTVMSVHVAISRLINVSNHVQNGTGPGRPLYLSKTILAISTSIQKCKDDEIMPHEDSFFRSAIVDLYFALENWPFAIAIYGRTIQELKNPWKKSLSDLAQSNTSTVEKSYESLLEVMDKMVIELDNS